LQNRVDLVEKLGAPQEIRADDTAPLETPAEKKSPKK
jgi:hypothetical protein